MFTSAGSSAAIDLMLALLEEDHGRELALWMARRLVVFLKRPGGQSQFSVQLAAQTATRSPVQRIQQMVRDDPAGRFTIQELASEAAMSARNFSRVFRREAGMSPADFVELTRSMPGGSGLLAVARLGAARAPIDRGSSPSSGVTPWERAAK